MATLARIQSDTLLATGQVTVFEFETITPPSGDRVTTPWKQRDITLPPDLVATLAAAIAAAPDVNPATP